MASQRESEKVRQAIRGLNGEDGDVPPILLVRAVVIAALEKQIAMEAIPNRKAGVVFCPICERRARSNYDMYCSGCGQALKYQEEAKEGA